MVIDLNYYCYNPKSQKNYCTIFNDTLPLGWKIGAATVISNAVVPYTLIENSFLNRALELGFYNIIQESFSPIKLTNYTDLVQNFNETNAVSNSGYRGLVQTIKWLPNLWIQNNLKPNYGSLIDSNFIKTFVFSSLGMITFFSIGATEGKISAPLTKIAFTTSLYTSLISTAFQYCSKDTTSGKFGTNLLSAQDTLAASLGLISSFIILDGAKNLYIYANQNSITYPEEEICKNNIFGIDDSTMQTINSWSNFTALTAGAMVTIGIEIYIGESAKAAQHTALVFGFSFAKASAVTLVEIAEDYIDLSGLFSIGDFDFI